MRKLSRLLTLTACLLSLYGCQKEEFAEAPVYGKIYCSSPHPEVGDTVTVLVEVLDAGNRLNSAEYRWKIRSPFTTYNKTVKTMRKAGQKSITEVPSFEWVFREDGKHRLELTAKFSYSMGDANSVMRGYSTARGEIEVYPKSN